MHVQESEHRFRKRIIQEDVQRSCRTPLRITEAVANVAVMRCGVRDMLPDPDARPQGLCRGCHRVPVTTDLHDGGEVLRPLHGKRPPVGYGKGRTDYPDVLRDQCEDPRQQLGRKTVDGLQSVDMSLRDVEGLLKFVGDRVPLGLR